ncbi:DMT family transporter, partial [Bacillus sp. STP3]|uniref:DMT family transporter n=1 Tax=Bacillus sp. STP3 TaxID=2338393 RepID=UPI0013DE1333
MNYWIGIILGAIGVLFITIPSKSANQEVSLIGDILILLSTFLFAFYTVFAKTTKTRTVFIKRGFYNINFNYWSCYSLTVCTGRNFLLRSPKVETWKTVLSVIYLVIGATILAYWFWNKALERDFSISKRIIFKCITINK